MPGRKHLSLPTLWHSMFASIHVLIHPADTERIYF